jgi:hypothetical protein
MYKIASQKRQSGLHHGSPKDWVNGEEKLSAQDQLTQMQRGIQLIEARILALPKGKERTALGVEKFEMQSALRELRASLGREKKRMDGLPEIFMNCAREILSPLQFKIIRAAADREWNLKKTTAIIEQLNTGE